MQDNQADADLGSNGPTMVPAGGTSEIFEIGKQHTAFLLSTSSLGGADHHTPLAQITNECAGVADGQNGVLGSDVYIPCSGTGVKQIVVGSGPPSLTPGETFSVSNPGPVTADPSTGLLWFVDRGAQKLDGVDFSTNPPTLRQQFTLATLSSAQHFPTPALTTDGSGHGIVLIEDGSSVNAFFTGAGGGTPGVAWSTPLTLDQVVQSRPVVDKHDGVDGVVIVGTENDSLYGLSLTDGSKVWGPVSIGTAEPLSNVQAFSGLGGCGDLDPLGITSNLAYDANEGNSGSGTVYAVGEREVGAMPQHVLVGVNPANGQENFAPVNVDLPTMAEVAAEQQRAGLAIANGNVYFGYGGLAGDCGNYHGYVVAASETNGAIVGNFEVANTGGNRAGAVWATTSFAFDASGNVYAATGNSFAPTQSPQDYSDAVLKLTPTVG
jgi:hypothetical protein